MKKHAILLMNLGGPNTPNSIEPFLYQLFSDPDIIQVPLGFFRNILAKLISYFRTPSVAKHYKKIGGASPILKLTLEQASALEEELTKSIPCKTYVGMRYSCPCMKNALATIQAQEPKSLVLVPLYPQYSMTTTLSSYNEFERFFYGNIITGNIKGKNDTRNGSNSSKETSSKETDKNSLREEKQTIPFPVISIQEWYDFPEYIQCIVELIEDKLKEITNPEERKKVHLVFSAHSLPLKTIQKGDPYEKQIQKTVELVVKKLSLENPSQLCYQSKVGPIKWLGPSTDKTIRKIAENPDQDILMIPISFVSDHYETLYEIDILYSEMAQKLGIRRFLRTDGLNSRPSFIQALAKLILKHMEKTKLL